MYIENLFDFLSCYNCEKPGKFFKCDLRKWAKQIFKSEFDNPWDLICGHANDKNHEQKSVFAQ